MTNCTFDAAPKPPWSTFGRIRSPAPKGRSQVFDPGKYLARPEVPAASGARARLFSRRVGRWAGISTYDFMSECTHLEPTSLSIATYSQGVSVCAIGIGHSMNTEPHFHVDLRAAMRKH